MRTVVITGGTKGIGAALVEIYAEHGATIITCARSQKDLDKLSKRIHTKYHAKVKTMVCDVSKKVDRQKFATLLQEESVDILINNAGVFYPGGIAEAEDGALEAMMETNLYSAYDFSRAVIPGMQKNGSGLIVNVCSIASITAYENGGGYAMSKAALLSMSRGLREEMKTSGVKVTAVLPGATYTNSWAGVELPEDRFIKAEDVAESIFDISNLSAQAVVEEIIIRPQLGDL